MTNKLVIISSNVEICITELYKQIFKIIDPSSRVLYLFEGVDNEIIHIDNSISKERIKRNRFYGIYAKHDENNEFEINYINIDEVLNINNKDCIPVLFLDDIEKINYYYSNPNFNVLSYYVWVDYFNYVSLKGVTANQENYNNYHNIIDKKISKLHYLNEYKFVFRFNNVSTIVDNIMDSAFYDKEIISRRNEIFKKLISEYDFFLNENSNMKIIDYNNDSDNSIGLSKTLQEEKLIVKDRVFDDEVKFRKFYNVDISFIRCIFNKRIHLKNTNCKINFIDCKFYDMVHFYDISQIELRYCIFEQKIDISNFTKFKQSCYPRLYLSNCTVQTMLIRDTKQYINIKIRKSDIDKLTLSNVQVNSLELMLSDVEHLDIRDVTKLKWNLNNTQLGRLFISDEIFGDIISYKTAVELACESSCTYLNITDKEREIRNKLEKYKNLSFTFSTIYNMYESNNLYEKSDKIYYIYKIFDFKYKISLLNLQLCKETNLFKKVKILFVTKDFNVFKGAIDLLYRFVFGYGVKIRNPIQVIISVFVLNFLLYTYLVYGINISLFITVDKVKIVSDSISTLNNYFSNNVTISIFYIQFFIYIFVTIFTAEIVRKIIRT